MKKQKIFLCLFILFGIVFIPFFAGCENEVLKKSLPAPNSVEYKINLDNGRQILYTQENPRASGYIFGISEVDTEDETDFLQYKTDKNYYDVSNIFINAKTYYFYAKYIGTGEYISSQISPINSQSIQHVLNTPFITLTNTTINWVAIDSADNYLIYCEYGGTKEAVATTLNTSYDLQNYINQKISNGVEEELGFSVVATARANYTRSAESNVVKYTAFLELEKPTDLSIYRINNRLYLQWRRVEHCENYVIKANKAEFIDVTITDCTISGNFLRYDLTYLFEEYGVGQFQFQVKSAQTNNYLPSDFSEKLDYTYRLTLSTPQNVVVTDLDGFVNISWSIVYVSLNNNVRADEYELWFSDINDNYQVKQFFVNNDGVNGLITTNSITLSYEQFGITEFSQVNDDNFRVQIVAKHFGYNNSYPSSSFDVVEIDHSLIAPQIIDNDLQKTITWEEVPGAQTYRISVIGESLTQQFTVTNTYFVYGDYLLEAGSYSLKCLAVSKSGNISEYSNIITKVVYNKLDTPTIIKVVTQNEYFKIDFEEVENAIDYTLFVCGQSIAENITISNNVVLIADAMQYKQNGKLSFQIRANNSGYYKASEKSNAYNINTKLSTPVISLNGNNVCWSDIENATSFNLYLDDNFVLVNSAVSSIDLTEYVNVNVARQIRVQAISEYFDESDLSNMLYYNRADAQHQGYTDKYFYFGQTYDYYITSEQEMIDVVDYSILNFLTNVNVYINYDNTTTISDKFKNAVDKKAGTFRVSYSASNSGSKTGNSTLHFDYATITNEPDYESMYTQYEHSMIYSADSTRDVSHQFATDTYIVSQDVYTTDGLISAVEHKAKPNFVSSNSVAETIYNKAKEILIEICDDNITDYYKALAIHDYIITHVSYDTYGLNRCNEYNAPLYELINNGTSVSVKQFHIGYFHYVESAMLYGLAVCDGYAKMFSLLCNMEGIDCMIISGLSNKTNESSGHAWNKISFDIDNDGEKECFVVDCTYDDPFNDDGYEYAIHEYFLIPDSTISERAERQWKNYPPTTETTDMFYSASQYTPYNLPLKIDNFNQGLQYLGYLNSPEYTVVEGLIARGLWQQIAGYVPSNIGYKAFTSIYDDYVLVIAYKK